MRRARPVRWRERAASGPGSAAASTAGSAARSTRPSWPPQSCRLASRERRRLERSRGTSSFPPSLYRLVDEFYQCFTFERLAQEAQGTSLHGARPQPLLGKSGHEDDRDAVTLRQQRFLQFDAVQAWHLQIADDAGRMVQMRRLQELFCGRKRVGDEAERRHEAFDRTAHRLVIVDDRYDRGVLQLLVLNMGAQPRRISGWRKPSHATNICHCGHRKNHIKVLDRCEFPRPTPVRDFARVRGRWPLDLEFGGSLALPFTPRCCGPAAP